MTTMSAIVRADRDVRDADDDGPFCVPCEVANRPFVEGHLSGDGHGHPSTRPLLLARAKDEYREAGRRLTALGARLAIGPPWNMLLDLFISGIGGHKLSVTALCIGARSSTTTALRYLSSLQAAGLVERSLDTTDARRSYVQLTAAGWHKMCWLLDQTEIDRTSAATICAVSNAAAFETHA